LSAQETATKMLAVGVWEYHRTDDRPLVMSCFKVNEEKLS